MRPFGCPLTILNTLDPLGKFDGKSDEGYLLGYSTTSKAFRVYNKRTKRVEENMHIDFLEDQPNVAGSGPDWMFDLDFLTNTMNYIPVSVENQVNVDAGTQEHYVAGSSEKDKEPTQEYILLPLHPHRPRISVEDVDSEDVADKEEQHTLTEAEQVLQDDLERMIAQECAAKAINDATRQAFEEEKKRAAQATSINKLNTGQTPIDASTLPNVDLPIDPNMPDLEDDYNIFPNDGIFSRAYDDEGWWVVEFKQEERSKGFVKYKSFGKLTSIIRNRQNLRPSELSVSMFSSQEESKDNYHKLRKMKVGLEAMAKMNGQFKLQKVVLAFASFMGFCILMDVRVNSYGILKRWSQDKYVADILKKFDFCSIKSATTPIMSNKPLVKDKDSVDVDVYIYRSMIGSLMYLIASRPDIMFDVCACARFQVTPKASHLNAVKRIFRYLKHQPKLGLWYPRDSPFELEDFLNSDYGGTSLDRKSTTGLRATYGAELVSAASLVNTARPTLSTAKLSKFGAARQIWCCQANLMLPGKFGAARQIWCCQTNLVLSGKFGAARQKFVLLVTVTTSVQRLSMKKRFGKKESVSKQGRKKSKPESTLDDSTVFDDQDADHGMEYMETEEAVDEGRQSGETEEVKLTDDTEVVEDKGSGDKGGNVEELVSTARPEVSTARPDIDAARQEDSVVEPRTPPTTTSIFNDEDITMAQTLIKMKEEKAKEKGVSIKDVDDSSRPERSILTLKPLLTIDPKDKGKGVLKESPVKKVKRSNLDAAQIAKDAEIARLIHEKKLIAEHQELASPEANHFCKELASPKQTALGKDISNPLIVGSLLKTIWLSVHHVIAMKPLTGSIKVKIKRRGLFGLEAFTTYCAWFNIGAASEDLVLLRRIEENRLSL
ncbi:hypothetical protein Tco_1315420 [Tanacetum coccineum]